MLKGGTWLARSRIEGFEEDGLVVAHGASRLTVGFSEILTAERLRSRRALRFHMREGEPLVVAVRRRELWSVEDRLRANGVRIVDCSGAILAPTLWDFEEELDREPVRVRQSSDNA
jgi:hypothetical protein